MSFSGLNFQTRTMRFGVGQNQKTDPRALEAPELGIGGNGSAGTVRLINLSGDGT